MKIFNKLVYINLNRIDCDGHSNQIKALILKINLISKTKKNIQIGMIIIKKFNYYIK
jgi:hypothetical protein